MIVPKSLLEDMKHLLHVGHLDIVKIKEQAHDILYWPGINADLKNIVNTCDTCQEYQNKQKDESLIAHDIPTTPWTYLSEKVKPILLLLVILQTFLIFVYFQINDLLLLLLIHKEFSPNLGSLRKLYQIINLNILEKIKNCLQNNGTSNMTHLVLITQNLMGKLNEPFRQ